MVNILLEKINQSAIRFLEPLTPIETYQTIVEQATRLINAEYGSIILENGGVFTRVYASNFAAYKTVNRKKANTYRSFKEKKIIIVNIKKTGKVHPELKESGIKWTIFIPLIYQNEAIGVMTLNSKHPIELGENDLEALKLFGSLASLAIRKTYLYNEAKTALDLRDVFIGLAAHELRTPLTSIYGYAQLIDSRVKKSEPIDPLWIRELLQETARMTYLTEELLVVNYLKSGKILFNFQKDSVMKVFYTAISKFKLEYPKHTLHISTSLKENDPKTIINGDIEKLSQAVYNILENAGKYSKESQPVSINLTSTAKKIKIEITDTGKGIPKEDLPHLFDGFYKGENNYQKGLGVGLYLAKYIVDKHKGSIAIKSSVGKGTKVVVTIPQ